MVTSVMDAATMEMVLPDQVSLRENLQAAYAAGTLDGAMRLLVETQAALRQDAHADLALAESLAGLFFEAETPVMMSAGAFDTVMDRIAMDRASPYSADRSDNPTRRAARAASTVIDEILRLPKPVQDLALDGIGAGGWTFAGPGLRTLPLDMGKGCTAKAEILRIEPGWGAPRHSHHGGEYTLVMAGSFSDERGRYRVGDIALATPSVTHRPVADPGEVCYCLAVTDAPLAFTGALGLLQKIWRH
jgi:putative transcriptional regulator